MQLKFDNILIVSEILKLISGDLNCPTCVLIRGALVGAVGAGVYPILLALPVNAGLATRYVQLFAVKGFIKMLG